jgi:hypothetical protein
MKCEGVLFIQFLIEKRGNFPSFLLENLFPFFLPWFIVAMNNNIDKLM